ncbi:MAG: AtpZ/AtpI family protein [Rickettsiales bacterium]
MESAKSHQHETAEGFTLVADLLAGTLVGAFIGYNIDRYFGTLPLMLIIMTILGVVAGFYNFYKLTILKKK